MTAGPTPAGCATAVAAPLLIASAPAEAGIGDLVKIMETRPLSKTKHHRLIRIVERAPERAVQVSAEEVMTGKAPKSR